MTVKNDPKVKKREVIVIGHQNPDTDSICSAIAYAKLKKQTEGSHFTACRTGEMSRETRFVLDRFRVKAPRLCTDVFAEVQDIDIRPVKGVSGDTSMRRAWEIMRDIDAETLPVISENEKLLGLSTLGDLAKAHMDSVNPYAVSAAKTPLKNIVSVLDATVVCGDISGCFERGKVIVGAASPELMETKIDKGDIVIVGNRYEAQLCAIEMDALMIIVCMGATVARSIVKLAEEKGCILLTTPFDSFAASNLVMQSIPIEANMTKIDKLLKFLPTSPLEDVRETMGKVRHRYFPICSASGKYKGLISRRNLLNLHKKQLILVDHNEGSQCVQGWEEAEILEIIDHHRIGTLQTDSPILFLNRPVGCTATIVFQLYRDADLMPDKKIAGLLLSAILSDTLVFRSPTCTGTDRDAAGKLAEIAGIDIYKYAEEMFAAAEDLTGETAEQVFFEDFKEFTQDDITFGVGQGSYMSEQNLKKATEILMEYAPEALKKTGYDMIYFMVTSINAESCTLICCGEGADTLAEEAFGVSACGGTVYLPGIVSRKKQLVPVLLNSMKKM